MSLNRIVVQVPPSTVFGVLVDAESYPYWVVGTRAIRGRDNEWPQVGSCLHHRAGVGPLVIEDSSEVKAIEDDVRLKLEVRIGWLGAGIVDVTLETVGPDRATVVTLVETMTGGLMHRIPSIALEPLMHARNALSLRRLARLAESRLALVTDNPGDVQVGSA